jgi:hypothetical protein
MRLLLNAALFSEGELGESFKRLRLDAVEDEDDIVDDEDKDDDAVAVYADTAEARGCEPSSLTCNEC